MRRTPALVCFALLGASVVGLQAADGAPTRSGRVAPVEASIRGSAPLHAFVQYDHPVTRTDVDRLQALGIAKVRPFKFVNAVAVLAPGAVIRKAARLSGVTRIQQDHGLRLDVDKSKKAIGVDKARAAKPKGLGLTGAGVRVAVLDSGVDSHHGDLATQVVTSLNFEGASFWDAYQDGAISDDVAEQTGAFATVDEVGHGTHVASTIAGTGKMSQTGADYTGMAPGARLVAMKIASGAQGVAYDMGWEHNAMAAIEYLIEHNKELKVRVVANSWGVFETDSPDSEPIIQMVKAGVAKGLLFVFSAGNDGPGPNTVGWPGAMGQVLTVASTVKTAPYGVSSFSSRGYQVDIAAPGSNIVAARSHGAVIDLGNSATPPQDMPFYMAISGTSMAQPHVAGVAALVLQAAPRLTAAQVEELLERTATDLGDPGKDKSYGYGMVNAFKAGQVATCIGTGAWGAKAEGCFAKFRALPKSKFTLDWNDRGDGSPTSQGGPVPV